MSDEEKRGRVKLTKRVLDALKPTNPRGERVYDAELQGFSVVAYPPSAKHPRGQKVFWLRYGHRRQRKWIKIGVYNPKLLVETARERAGELLSQAVGGKDPAAERDALEASPTFKEWAARYCQRAEGRLAAKWVYEMRRYLDAAPFKKKQLVEVSVQDARQFYSLMREKGVTTANRALAALKSCLASAEKEGLIPISPLAGRGKVEVVKERGRRKRFLTDVELSRFLAALDGWPDPKVAGAFRLMAMTGLRRSEMLRAKWADLDYPEGIWNLPETKAGEEQSIPLTEDVKAALEKVPRFVGCEYIIPGQMKHSENGSIQIMQRKTLHAAWHGVCKAAKIEGATPHDLRRTYGRLILKATGNIVLVQKLLRHSDIRVTQRIYSPVTQEDTREAAEAAATERRSRLKVVNGGKEEEE